MKQIFRTLALAAAALAAASASSASTTITVDPKTTFGTWEGWGVSLCWWTRVLGESTLAADLLWSMNSSVAIPGDPTHVPALGFTVARYNVGGTNNATVNGTTASLSPSFPWWKQLESFWVDGEDWDPATPSWNWSADPTQVSALTLALQRGVKTVELFSNSPPWWMLKNLNPSGSNDGSSDNLLPAYYRAHAHYMATVAAQFLAPTGPFAAQPLPTPITVEPFNEPIANWWKSTGTQEGCHFDASTQQTVALLLADELAKAGLGKDRARIACSDESQTDMALGTWAALNASARAVIDQVNVHGYQGTSGNRSGLYWQVVVEGGKAFRMSEHGDGDDSGATLVTNLLLDFAELHMTSWVYWQSFDSDEGWTLIRNNIPTSTDLAAPTTKYFSLAQFTRHIRPGMTILSTSGGSFGAVAAYDPASLTLVLVTASPGGHGSDTDTTFDLSAFASVQAGTATRWVTTLASSGGKDTYTAYTDVTVTSSAAVARVPANSVVTVVVNGVQL